MSKFHFDTLGCGIVLDVKSAIIYSSPQFTLCGVHHLSQIQNGTPASNIIVGGFSQGGVVASRYALVSDIKLGGCCVIGSWIPMWEEYPKSFGKATKSIPFWVGHGDSDNMVNHAVAKKCSDFVKSLGVDVNFCMYEHVGHHTCTKQINDVSKFIEQNTNHPPEYGEFLP